MADPAVFDCPELAALWSELRRRFEGTGDGEVRTVRLSGLDPAQRAGTRMRWTRAPGARAPSCVRWRRGPPPGRRRS